MCEVGFCNGQGYGSPKPHLPSSGRVVRADGMSTESLGHAGKFSYCNVRVFIRWTNSNTRRRKVSEVPSSRLQLIVYVSGKLKFHPIRGLLSSVFYRPSNRHTLASAFCTCAGDGDCTCFHVQYRCSVSEDGATGISGTKISTSRVDMARSQTGYLRRRP